MASTANKTIAKNTLLLYARKVFTLVLAVYMSRLLLNRLGIIDFGIYGLIVSVITVFSALRSLFSTSIQRFLNIANGSEKIEEVIEIFSLGLKIHVWIAIIFLIAAEIGGSIMMHFLDIPKDKYSDAYIVLQFSLFTAVVTILTVPYDALIIANEKFTIFAAFSIFESFLKLLVVVLLIFSPISRLITYAAFLLIVSIINLAVNFIYCHRKFGEVSHYRNIRNNELLKQMTGFAGWQFLGNTAYTLSQSGINIVININGGVIVNAARSIAYQAMNAISQFISDLNLSFQPRTMMYYAAGDLNKFYRLLYINSKINFEISSILGFTIFVFAEPILQLWLGEIPPFSVGFVRALMLFIIVRSLYPPLDLYFKSYGNIKDFQILEMIISTLSLGLSWLLLKLKYPYYSVFIGMTVIEVINLMAILILAKYKHRFPIIQYYHNVGIRVMFCLILIIMGIKTLSFTKYNEFSIYINIFFIIVSLFGSFVLISLILFSKRELKAMIWLIRSVKTTN